MIEVLASYPMCTKYTVPLLIKESQNTVILILYWWMSRTDLEGIGLAMTILFVYPVLSRTVFRRKNLACELKELGIRVKIKELVIPILLFADDISLLTECEKDLQLLLDKLVQWCNKWKIKINESKSKIMHFRP